MYILIPILNAAVNQLDRKTLRNTLAAVFIAFSCFSLILSADPYNLRDGYSLIWLAVMYLLGAYIEKYEIGKNLSALKCLLFYVLSVAATFAAGIILWYLFKRDNLLLSYISPTVISEAIFLLLFFSKLKFKGKFISVIKLFAPAALSVYIIHDNLWISKYFITDALLPLAAANPLIMALGILASAVVLYLICFLIDIVRIQLFKLLRIKKLCLFAENKLLRLADKHTS